LALVLGIAGIVILLGGDIAALDKAPLGPVFMLAAAILWAAGAVYQKKIDWETPVLTLTAWQLLFGGTPIVLCALLFESPNWAAFTPSAIGAVAYNIVGPLSFCYYAWFKIVDLYPATAAGISVLMVPVIGVASAALALGEPLGLAEVAALVFVGSAIGLVLFAPKAPGTEVAYKSP
jgi:drug/metabolite transporter (DMT)-like permease